jgi:CBS domain containing-hemolysin-like protein
MSLLIFYLFLAIVISFLCSILEAVLLSVTPSYISVAQNKGEKTGELLKKLKADIDRPLSAILSLNTIAHTVGAAGVGAQAQVVFGNAYVSVTSAILTLLILVLSEIIPKTLGATYWRNLAPFASRTTYWLIITVYPLVMLSKGITTWLASDEKRPTLSREEFSAMADMGAEEGVFEESESKILKNLIRFKSLRAQDIMTPRIVVMKFLEDKTISDVIDSVEELHFSRLPVYGSDEESITGYVLKHELYLNLLRGHKDKKLKELKRNILIVPEIISLKVMFEWFLEKQEHIAAVVDEYGGFSGIVTMEDVVETLIGMEIVDEADAIEDMQKLARKNWIERAKRLGIVLPDSLKTEN